jgi:hypothetical protein
MLGAMVLTRKVVVECWNYPLTTLFICLEHRCVDLININSLDVLFAVC